MEKMNRSKVIIVLAVVSLLIALFTVTAIAKEQSKDPWSLTNYEYKECAEELTGIGPGELVESTCACTTGKTVIGGGASIKDNPEYWTLVNSYPQLGVFYWKPFAQWVAEFRNDTAGKQNISLSVYVICADPFPGCEPGVICHPDCEICIDGSCEPTNEGGSCGMIGIGGTCVGGECL